MGAVWVAHHLGLQNQVAVEFLEDEQAGDAAAASASPARLLPRPGGARTSSRSSTTAFLPACRTSSWSSSRVRTCAPVSESAARSPPRSPRPSSTKSQKRSPRPTLSASSTGTSSRRTSTSDHLGGRLRQAARLRPGAAVHVDCGVAALRGDAAVYEPGTDRRCPARCAIGHLVAGRTGLRVFGMERARSGGRRSARSRWRYTRYPYPDRRTFGPRCQRQTLVRASVRTVTRGPFCFGDGRGGGLGRVPRGRSPRSPHPSAAICSSRFEETVTDNFVLTGASPGSITRRSTRPRIPAALIAAMAGMTIIIVATVTYRVSGRSASTPIPGPIATEATPVAIPPPARSAIEPGRDPVEAVASEAPAPAQAPTARSPAPAKPRELARAVPSPAPSASTANPGEERAVSSVYEMPDERR